METYTTFKKTRVKTLFLHHFHKKIQIQWILMKRVLSFHYKLLHLLMAIEQIYTILSWTFISILFSTEKN